MLVLVVCASRSVPITVSQCVKLGDRNQPNLDWSSSSSITLGDESLVIVDNETVVVVVVVLRDSNGCTAESTASPFTAAATTDC